MIAVGSFPSEEFLKTLEPQKPAERVAVTVLEAALRETLQKETLFNKETPQENITDFSNIIGVYNNAHNVFISPEGVQKWKDKEIIEDVSGGDYTIIKYRPFEQCPYPVQNYVVKKAIRKYQNIIAPSVNAYNIQIREENKARLEMKQAEGKTTRFKFKTNFR